MFLYPGYFYLHPGYRYKTASLRKSSLPSPVVSRETSEYDSLVFPSVPQGISLRPTRYFPPSHKVFPSVPQGIFLRSTRDWIFPSCIGYSHDVLDIFVRIANFVHDVTRQAFLPFHKDYVIMSLTPLIMLLTPLIMSLTPSLDATSPLI